MPSGAKKRKAARKKKEHQPVSTPSHEDDDGKQQDDKDSDVGELTSPTSHDQHSHQSLLTDGEEEENLKGRNTSNSPSEEALSIQDSEEPSIVVQEDFVVPADMEVEIKDKSSKNDDASSSESSSSGNSIHSSSDVESHCIKNGKAATDIAPVVDSGNDSESFSGVSAENVVSAEIEDGVDSVVEKLPGEDSKNTSTLSSVTSYIVEPVESEEKRQSLIEDKVGISTVFMDLPLKRKEESIGNIVTSDPKECVTQESDDRVAADIGVEPEKDSGVAEVLLVPAPQSVQTTTWKSCCGLFEVFAGSGR